MTPVDRFDRELPEALLDVAGSPATDYLTDILGRTARTRQRPAWASLERWLPMDLATPRAATARVPWRTIGVLALVAILLAALVALYAGTQRRVPAPFGPAANGLITFARDGDIYVGDLATGTSRLLVGGPEDDSGPSYSPDGTRIGFLRGTPSGDDVVVVNADGSNVRALNPAPLESLTLAVWMPTSDGLIVDHSANGSKRLEILGLDGTAPRVLADDVAVDTVAFRPPDGREFVVRAEVDGVWGLYAMSVDGGSPRLLAPATYTAGLPDQDLNNPAYSADGTRITYNRYVPPEGTTLEAIQIWTMNADGSDQHRFNAEGPNGWWEGAAIPSPDGKWLAAWRVPPGESSHFAFFAADGSGDPISTADRPGFARYVWAPDSSVVLANPLEPSEGSQLLIDPSDGAQRAAPWAVNADPDWQRLAP